MSKMCELNVEVALNGEAIITGWKLNHWVPVPRDMLEHILTESKDGAFYPYRLHHLGKEHLKYDHLNDCFLMRVRNFY